MEFKVELRKSNPSSTYKFYEYFFNKQDRLIHKIVT